MSFSLTILALFARLRVLVQQILLDVVSVFNMVSSLSQKKQSVKISQEGIEGYREFYPENEEYVTLECVWNTDKFILLERSHKSEKKSQEGDGESSFPLGDSAVRYQSIESFLRDDELGSKKAEAGRRGPTDVNEDKTNLLASTSFQNDDIDQVDSALNMGESSGTSLTAGQKFAAESGLLATSSTSPNSNLLKAKSGTKKVAFVSVKRPAPATSNSLELPIKEPEKKSGDQEDKFYNLLTSLNVKDSLV